MVMQAVNVFMQAAHCTDANRRVHVNINFIDHGKKTEINVSCGYHQLDRSRSPKMHCIHLLVFTDEVNLCPGCLY